MAAATAAASGRLGRWAPPAVRSSCAPPAAATPTPPATLSSWAAPRALHRHHRCQHLHAPAAAAAAACSTAATTVAAASRTHLWARPAAAPAPAAAAPPPGRRGRCPHLRAPAPSRRQRLAVRALGVPDSVDATVRSALAIAAAGGISYSLLVALAAPPPPPPSAASRALGPGAGRHSASRGGGPEEEDEGFVWGLMGAISCLPLFGWLAWALAAITNERRAALYGLYAALYGSPLLLRGLDWRDPWALTMLGLCVAHVQAERIARTEPGTLSAIRPLGLLGGAVRGALGGGGQLLRGVGGVLADDARRVSRRPGAPELGPGDERAELDLKLSKDADPLLDPESAAAPPVDPRLDPARDPAVDNYAARELLAFDEQLRERAAKKDATKQQQEQPW